MTVNDDIVDVSHMITMMFTLFTVVTMTCALVSAAGPPTIEWGPETPALYGSRMFPACAQTAITNNSGSHQTLVLYGGYGSQSYEDDVYVATMTSSTSLNFTRVVNKTGVSTNGINGAMAITARGRIILVGNTGEGLSNQVISASSDGGRSWTRISNSSVIPPNFMFAMTAVPYTEVVIVVSGVGSKYTNTNNTYVSTDGFGSIWTVTGQVPYNGNIQGPAAVALHDYIPSVRNGTVYVSGGFSQVAFAYLNVIHVTTDYGYTWRSWTASWAPRYGHVMLADATDNLYIVGGRVDSGFVNDVFYSGDRGITWSPVKFTGKSAPLPWLLSCAALTTVGQSTFIVEYGGISNSTVSNGYTIGQITAVTSQLA